MICKRRYWALFWPRGSNPEMANISDISGNGSDLITEKIDGARRDHIMAALVAFSWFVLFGPVYLYFMSTVWARPENGHMPFIMAICAGLLFAELSSGRVVRNANVNSTIIGFFLLLSGIGLLVFSRVEQIEFIQSLCQLIIGLGAILIIFGWSSLKNFWFILALGLYLIVWPGWIVDELTFPLKMMVARFVADGLYLFGLPISHSGAVINAGAYELLVADACAGMNSLIALTSIGVVYAYIVKRSSKLVNIIMLSMLIPIAVIANMFRVALLILLTYFFGYDAGQSFLHELSGMVMFAASLGFVFLLDAVLVRVVGRKNAREKNTKKKDIVRVSNEGL